MMVNGITSYTASSATCEMQETVGFFRIDFGPRSITTAFTAWGVTQFVMTSTAPWYEFPQLKSHLAESAPSL